MNSKSNKIKIYIVPILVIAILTAIDQLTKLMITSKFALYESRTLIKGVFSLTYIRNEGMAWGMMQGKINFFVIATILVMIGCIVIYGRIKDNNRFKTLRICILFLASGSLGNLIDRIRLNYVVDFFDFELINFPIFNVADIYVTCTMFVIFILLCFVYKEKDMNQIFESKRKKNVEGSEVKDVVEVKDESVIEKSVEESEEKLEE